MPAFAARRPTRDIDLAASGFPNEPTGVEARVRAILDVFSSDPDGLAFDGDSVHNEIIRDGADYTGVRVHVVATLANARIPIHVDVSFGDPIWPAPRETAVPRLLGGEVLLLGYPDHMVLAEKIVTAIDRGTANTRWRDFVDIVSISYARTIDEADLTTAIATVASHRRVETRTLAETLDGMGDIAQGRWAPWRRKQRLAPSTPASFAELLTSVITFADPVLDGTAHGHTRQPLSRRWVPTERLA